MSGPDSNESVDALDAVLRRGLHSAPVSAQALERIRAATESEWRAQVGYGDRARGWRTYASAAAAATLVLIGGLFVVIRNPSAPLDTVLGRLERVEYPGAVERHTWRKDRSIANGERLHGGQRILVRGGARIALAGAGSLRLAAGTGVEILSDHLLKLTDGDIYVDIPPESSRQVQLVVQTPAGSFTHVGTQFQVAVHAGQTQVRVREGQVRWSSAAGDVVAAAGTQLLIDRQGKATRGEIAVAGADWVWAEMLAAAFEIENRSLTDYLQYFARETGRTLVFADASVERRAAETKLHGSIRELSPVDALSAVMATTSLRFTLGVESVRIESGGDPAKKIR